MKLYNSLTKEKDYVETITPGKVSMYHCGPTVYDHVHVGNLRSFILGDLLRRSFAYLGYEVLQVMNITDVGHLVSDGDEGDDKMTKALKREGKEVSVENMLSIARIYEASFLKDLADLNVLLPHHLPRASEHIDDDIAIIKKLEERGFTYTTSDGVYFDTSKMSDYGKLGGLNQDDGESRISGNAEKHQPADFALWKFDQNLGWDSPWGQGFPGWHIECSGMGMRYLGEQFDIHTGGSDLKSVHHNNEIAQSECATGVCPYVKYWVHGEMLNFGGAKLSKSTGGNITLQSLKEREIEPLAYRYLVLQTHYRSPMSFTYEGLKATETGLKRIRKEVIKLRELAGGTHGTVSGNSKVQFTEKIEDDLNMPQALAVFHDVLKSDLDPADKLVTLYDFDRVLGLGLEYYEEASFEISEEIQHLLNQRKEARDAKDFEASDRIRDQLSDMGYTVSDSDGEQRITKK
ncbi:cysteine--tRNA ligase [Patescibacteria group bacterium]|nr:cysteine--tRNA ligase [Patescibacteria group bacterium]